MLRSGPVTQLTAAQAAAEIRSAYYSLVDSLSAISGLVDIDFRITTEEELLRYAGRILVNQEGLDGCKLFSLRDDDIECVACVIGTRLSSASLAAEIAAATRPAHDYSNTESEDIVQHRLRNADGVMMCMPIEAFEKPVAVLHAYTTDPDKCKEAHQHSLRLFKLVLGRMIENQRLVSRMGMVIKDQTKEINTTTSRLQKQIDERKETECLLRETKERFKDFASVAADWFWETDTNLCITYLSERFEQVTGVNPDQALGSPNYGIPGIQKMMGWESHLEHLEQRRPFTNFQFVCAKPDSASRVLSISGKPIYDKHGIFQGYRGAGQDVTKTQRLSEELAYHAQHDSLTGLINRRVFEQHLGRVLAETQGEKSEHILCYLDLDQFKVINDTCGHAAGDELLCQIANLLLRRVRKTDILARLGGDEFGLLMENCSLRHASRIADTLRDGIQEFRFSFKGKVFSISVSIGMVPLDKHNTSVANALSAADAACYIAKNQGRNRVHIYKENGAQLIRWKREMELTSTMTQALERNGFKLAFQSIVPANDSGEGSMFEVLLRMEDESGNVMLPNAFLPAAERYSMLTRIDRWVARKALEWLEQNRDRCRDLKLCAVNLSGQSLSDPEFQDFLNELFDETKVPPEKVCFEITETAAISDLSNTQRFIEMFRERGCQFALDDFGSGLSSFAYLKTLPVDYVKIDGLFVKDVTSDPIDLAMVKSINEISHLMGKRTIAEHVEDEQTLAILRDIGVDYVQGNGVSRPRPAVGRKVALRKIAEC
ncbi:MAG: EAL domain-containing protein [Gammaproteobacteria bacterium]|nr:EAL domain-containing protein [Gammaproteobacteria bacterium]